MTARLRGILTQNFETDRPRDIDRKLLTLLYVLVRLLLLIKTSIAITKRDIDMRCVGPNWT